MPRTLSIDNSVASRDIADTLYDVYDERVLRKFSTATNKLKYLAEFGLKGNHRHYSP
jgi:hypothetical protein